MSVDAQSVGVYAIFNELVVNGFSTTFRKLFVVSRSTSLLVSITVDRNLGILVCLHPFSNVVNVNHFALSNLRRVEREANG